MMVIAFQSSAIFSLPVRPALTPMAVYLSTSRSVRGCLAWLLRFQNLELRVPGYVIKIAIIVEQREIVLDGD